MKKLLVLLSLSFVMAAQADEGRGGDLRNQLDACKGSESETLVCVSKVFLEKLNQMERALGRIERGVSNIDSLPEPLDPSRKDHLFSAKNGSNVIFTAIISGNLRQDQIQCERILNYEEFQIAKVDYYFDGSYYDYWNNQDRKAVIGECMKRAQLLNN